MKIIKDIFLLLFKNETLMYVISREICSIGQS